MRIFLFTEIYWSFSFWPKIANHKLLCLVFLVSNIDALRIRSFLLQHSPLTLSVCLCVKYVLNVSYTTLRRCSPNRSKKYCAHSMNVTSKILCICNLRPNRLHKIFELSIIIVVMWKSEWVRIFFVSWIVKVMSYFSGDSFKVNSNIDRKKEWMHSFIRRLFAIRWPHYI